MLIARIWRSWEKQRYFEWCLSNKNSCNASRWKCIERQKLIYAVSCLFSPLERSENLSRPRRDFRLNERDKCKKMRNNVTMFPQLGHVDPTRCTQLVSSCNRMRARMSPSGRLIITYKHAIMRTMRDIVKHLKLIQWIMRRMFSE